MRFILNFFFFGLLFYLIYLFFPEAFSTLVSWADKVVDFFADLFSRIGERMFHRTETPPPATDVPRALAWFIAALFRR